MRSSIMIPAAFAALAAAMPQEIDWDAVAALDPVPTADIPIVDVAAQATTVAYTAVQAASTVVADIAASGIVGNPTKRTAEKRDADTAEAFAARTDIPAAALAAKTPKGYTRTFQNLNASNNAFGYMGYTVLDTYDTQLCSEKCDAINGCASFNLYFERDPVCDPATCSTRDSITNIKCVFWGGPVNTANAVNDGQYRLDFHVVIGGSNGYQNNTIAAAPGYAEANYLGNAAINAPLDCNKRDTYMGVKIWTDGPFDANKCAAACTATSEYDVKHGLPTKANPQTCQFFNTYLLLKNGTAVGQYCAMYNETWTNDKATNVGQYRGYNKYTISNSYSYSNKTDAGVCKKA